MVQEWCVPYRCDAAAAPWFQRSRAWGEARLSDAANSLTFAGQRQRRCCPGPGLPAHNCSVCSETDTIWLRSAYSRASKSANESDEDTFHKLTSSCPAATL